MNTPALIERRIIARENTTFVKLAFPYPTDQGLVRPIKEGNDYCGGKTSGFC